MMPTFEEITAPRDVAYRLEVINYEYRKMLTAITAFVDFCGIYKAKKNFLDIQIQEDHFEGLFTIIEDYSFEVREALEELEKAVSEYSKKQDKT